MLPQLSKKRSDQPNENKLLKPGADGDPRMRSSSSKKVRSGGGFMKNNIIDSGTRSAVTQQLISQENATMAKYQKFKRTEDLASEIKLIQRKIKSCQKKLQQDKLKQQNRNHPQNNNLYDFQRVVKREMEIQGYTAPPEDNPHNFDYLTNPKLKGVQEEPEPQMREEAVPQSLFVASKPFDIQAGVEKLERFYENSLKKKFERRRKTPKLYITHKTNALSKYGKVETSTEHMFRVLTKEATPQQIYPTIPNFPVVKDALSRNIVAYLGDYKPFLDKTKEIQQPKNGDGQEQTNSNSQPIQMYASCNAGKVVDTGTE